MQQAVSYIQTTLGSCMHPSIMPVFYTLAAVWSIIPRAFARLIYAMQPRTTSFPGCSAANIPRAYGDTAYVELPDHMFMRTSLLCQWGAQVSPLFHRSNPLAAGRIKPTPAIRAFLLVWQENLSSSRRNLAQVAERPGADHKPSPLPGRVVSLN